MLAMYQHFDHLAEQERQFPLYLPLSFLLCRLTRMVIYKGYKYKKIEVQDERNSYFLLKEVHK